MKYIFTTLLLLVSLFVAKAQSIYKKDFIQFCNIIKTDYAYLDAYHIPWDKVTQYYTPQADTISSRNAMITLLEKMLCELHNSHNILNTNLPTSTKMVPTDMDIAAYWDGKECHILDIRKDSKAEKCGLKPGMIITNINGMQPYAAMQQYLPTYTPQYTQAMLQYALNFAVSGTHHAERAITVQLEKTRQTFYPDKQTVAYPEAPLTAKWLNAHTAYLKLNNSIGNTDMIPAMDSIIESMITAKYFVLDLTETPSGGNSTVARALMGHFVDTTMAYQAHSYNELPYNTIKHWVEYVSPRGKQFKGKVYVLVGYWTGSMAEGTAIGFDAMKKATVIGTDMAHLIGAVSNYTLDNTHIPFQIATERLYHINGIPRESYKPKVYTHHTNETWLALQGYIAK